MLEALLARVQMRARMARRHAPRAPEPQIQALPRAALPVEPPLPTLPPTPDARAAIETEVMKHTPAPEAVAASATRILAAEPAVPAQSRAQLVGEAKPDVIEVDEAELLSADAAPSDDIFVDEDIEPPPPSSKRPIPMEQIAESQKDEPALPPPPESGKLIATVPAFDDDFTGVREASHQLPPLAPNEPPIELAPIEPPKVAGPEELEVELSTAPVEPEDVEPITPLPQVGVPRFRPTAPSFHPEHTRATLPEGQAAAAAQGAVEPFTPKTFGELFDASLAL